MNDSKELQDDIAEFICNYLNIKNMSINEKTTVVKFMNSTTDKPKQKETPGESNIIIKELIEAY